MDISENMRDANTGKMTSVRKEPELNIRRYQEKYGT